VEDDIEEESEHSMEGEEEEEEENGSEGEEEEEEDFLEGVEQTRPADWGLHFGMLPGVAEAMLDSGEEDEEEGNSLDESGGSEEGSEGSGSSSRSSSQSHDDEGDNGRPAGEPRVFRLRRLAEQIDYNDPSSFIRCLEDEVIAAGYINIARPDALHKLEHDQGKEQQSELEQKKRMQLRLKSG
jgi:hypothetical protein